MRSHRFLGLFLIPVALVSVGCDEQNSPTALDEAGSVSSVPRSTASANTMVPLHGQLTGTGIPTGEPFACDPPATPSDLVQFEGTVSHLGRSASTGRGCNTVTGFVFPTAFITQVGQTAIEAANGDLVYATYIGSVDVNVACTALTVITLDLTITGGTGRFAGGTGTATFHGTQVPSACPPDSDPAPLFIEGTLDGQISTVGSNRQ